MAPAPSTKMSAPTTTLLMMVPPLGAGPDTTQVETIAHTPSSPRRMSR